VPATPLAHTTRESTGLTACRRLDVPLSCGVRRGERRDRSSSASGAGDELGNEAFGSAASPAQPAVKAVSAVMSAAGRFMIMVRSYDHDEGAVKLDLEVQVPVSGRGLVRFRLRAVRKWT
jgi:hypothetical protein